MLKKVLSVIICVIFLLTLAVIPGYANSTVNQSYNLGQMNLQGISNDTSYDWGHSIIKIGDVYKMWWTRGDPYDTIWFAESKDTINWYNVQKVMTPANSTWEKMHLARPNVIYVNNQYIMYYEAPSTVDAYGVETDNNIFRATSTDGIHWNKYPSNANPVPVIQMPAGTSGRGFYGVGQPTVLYKNNQYIMYYTFAAEPLAGPTGGNMITRATSSDGISWPGSSDTHQRLVQGSAADVKFSTQLNKYVMAFTVNNQVGRTNPPPDSEFNYGVHVVTSADGISWPATTYWDMANDSNNATYGLPRKTRGFAGFVTDPTGNVTGKTFFISYFAGDIHQPGEDFRNTCSTWNGNIVCVKLSDFTTNPLTFPEGSNIKGQNSGTIYRSYNEQKCPFINWTTYTAINGNQLGYLTVPDSYISAIPSYRYYLEGLNIKGQSDGSIYWCKNFVRYTYSSWSDFLAKNNNDPNAYHVLTDSEFASVSSSLPVAGPRP